MTDETILAAALAKADPADRTAYLAAACAGDSERRRRIEGQLAAHDPTVPPPDLEATSVRAPDGDESHAPLGDGMGRFLAPPGRSGSLGRIGHYEVLEVLGRGGFGIVFRAFDDVLQRVVAVKVLAPMMAATSPARKRFLREARPSAAVRHENVVQVYAVEETPLPYLVMEFIPGQSLQQRIDRTGPLEVAEVLRVGRQIAEGLAAAHATGLIHRDVKPANVLIEAGPQGRIKLTDFGLARAADDASLTQSGVVAGTPLYMAPEQARGEPLDHRADLFSLGSVLYAMCTGRPPFRANSTLAVLKRVAEDAPRPIREVIPEVPEWLCEVIARMLAKEPAQRFQTARVVADALARDPAQLGRPDPGRTASSVWGKTARPVRRRTVVAVAATFVLATLGGFGVHLLTRPAPPAVVESERGVGPGPDAPPTAAPFTDADVERVAALPPREQLLAIAEELRRRNPGFDGRFTGLGKPGPKVEGGKVTELGFATDHVTDISPLRALSGLRRLRCSGEQRSGQLTDLSPLRGLALTDLSCPSNAGLRDLSPLKGMPLVTLNASQTAVANIAVLEEMPLSSVWLNHTLVADLSP